jgi:hypothetical protein
MSAVVLVEKYAYLCRKVYDDVGQVLANKLVSDTRFAQVAVLEVNAYDRKAAAREVCCEVLADETSCPSD